MTKLNGLKGACVLGTLLGVVAVGCGGAGTAQGSDPAKTSAAAPAASGSAAPGNGPATGGGPSRDQVNAILKDHTRELKACYDREKDRGMAYKGDTKFRVKLEPSGKVADVQGVDTPPAGEFLSSCVSESMKGWTFPSSSQGHSLTIAVPW